MESTFQFLVGSLNLARLNKGIQELLSICEGNCIYSLLGGEARRVRGILLTGEGPVEQIDNNRLP